MGAEPESYFPHDYREGRRAFIAAAQGRGLDVVSRLLPGAQGPDGKPLFLDVCAMGPRNASRALLLTSATHGVEGYFGSGVQTGLLRQGVTPPGGVRLVMVHALNPFGFAWDRRVNEGNIDINRNFIDHAKAPRNRGYDELAEAIALRDVSPDGMARADALLDAYARKHGAAAWQAAISAGQYSHPDGLFYGGTAPSWSAQALRSVLTEDLPGIDRLIALDFHTGLGESGAGEIIVDAAPGSMAYARAQALWGAMVGSESAGEPLSAPLTGTLDRGLAAMLPGVEQTFAALEVGTVPLTAMIRALRLANWQDRFAPDGTRADEIGRLMRDAFYTDTPAWKRKAWALAQKSVHAALASL